MFAATRRSHLEIASSPGSVQQLMPERDSERFEGVDFSPTGDLLAVAVADTNSE